MAKFAKFLVAAAGAVVLVGDVFLGGVFFSEDIEQSVIALLTALAVYFVPNVPDPPA